MKQRDALPMRLGNRAHCRQRRRNPKGNSKMANVILKNNFTGNTISVPSSKTGNWYGPSNRTSDGTAMFDPVPKYRRSNPKIDLYGENDGGFSPYIASTKMFRTVRDALHYYKSRPINGRRIVRARIDK